MNAIIETNTANQPRIKAQMVKVWDIVVRLFHWSLVVTFALAWLTADELERAHEWIGYTVGGLIVLRLIWGITGTRYARFVQFVKGPSATIAYLKSMMSGRERRYLGHNPAGAAMVMALLLSIMALTLSGWMMTLDMFWRSEWVEELHEVLANSVLFLVVAHVAGVFLAGRRHKENLVRAMITGYKRGASENDVE